MTAVELFKFEGHNVRVVMIDDKPWWVLNDVCEVLEISNARNVAARINKDYVRSADVVDGRGQVRQTNVVNEPGLYKVIFRSDKPEAERFQTWVFEEVLPSIRKTGQYAVALSPAKQLVLHAQRLVEIEEEQERLAREVKKNAGEILALNSRVDELVLPDSWFTAVAYSKWKGYAQTDLITLARVGKKAASIGAGLGIEAQRVKDPRFGWVNAWPEAVWEDAWV